MRRAAVTQVVDDVLQEYGFAEHQVQRVRVERYHPVLSTLQPVADVGQRRAQFVCHVADHRFALLFQLFAPVGESLRARAKLPISSRVLTVPGQGSQPAPMTWCRVRRSPNTTGVPQRSASAVVIMPCLVSVALPAGSLTR
jgi:hypothetical protein